MTKKKKPSFEESYPLIEKEIEKWRRMWRLKARPDIDFDDVKSIVIYHIYKKWGKFNPDVTVLRNWLSKVFRNQIINLLRNFYYNFSPPCSQCSFSAVEEECNFTSSGRKDCECPLYNRWVKSKKRNKYHVLMPVPAENHFYEICSQSSEYLDYDKAKGNLEQVLKKRLTTMQWKVYVLLYIKNKSESVVTKLLGFKPEASHKGSCKNIRDIKKIIIQKSREILLKEQIDI